MLVLLFTVETSDSWVKTDFNLIVTITMPYKFCSHPGLFGSVYIKWIFLITKFKYLHLRLMELREQGIKNKREWD